MAAARLAVLRALWSPTKTIPSLTVRDITCIDFLALRRAGYDGVVFDKDNCLTRPLEDAPVSQLVNTLRDVTALFPKHHVLVVSNSAGSYGDDVEWIEADAVERAFTRAISDPPTTKLPRTTTTQKTSTTTEERLVHVLRHRRKKPSRRCANEIWEYFEQVKPWRQSSLSSSQLANNTQATSSPSKIMDAILPVEPLRLPLSPPPPIDATNGRPRLVFIGDRIMTDILLANEMGAYSVLTTHLWKHNDVLFLRYIESTFLAAVRGWLWLKTREWRRMSQTSWAVMRAIGRGMVGVWSLLVRSGRRSTTQSLQAKGADDVLRVEHGAGVHPRVITPYFDGKKMRIDS